MNATGMDENKIAGKQGGNVAQKARIELEKRTGQKIITSDNFLTPSKSLPEDKEQV